jgi:aerobic C4-dicarboxylate transport protein
MAFTIGSYGLEALSKLLVLMAGFYLAAIIFVVVILGAIADYTGFCDALVVQSRRSAWWSQRGQL